MTSITDIMLERYLAGDLPAARVAELESALATDPELAKRVQVMRDSTKRFFETEPPERFARRMAGRIELGEPPQVSWLTWLQAWSPAVVLFCAVFGIFWSTFEGAPQDDFTLGPRLDAIARVDPVAPRSAETDAAMRVEAQEEVAPDKLNQVQPTPKEPIRLSVSKRINESPPKKHSIAMKTASKASPIEKTPRNRENEVKPESVLDVAALPPQATPMIERRNTGAARGPAPKIASRASKKSLSRVMLLQTPRRLHLVAKATDGSQRRLESRAELVSDEIMVLDPAWRGPLHWGYLIASPGASVPVINKLKSRPWSAQEEVKPPDGFFGEATVWLAACPVSFSTEDILFDGLSVRSKNESCQVFSFFVIFLK